MANIRIHIDDDDARRLDELADELEMSGEQLAEHATRVFLRRSRGAFRVPDCLSGPAWQGDDGVWRLKIKTPFTGERSRWRRYGIHIPIDAIRPESEIQGARQRGLLVVSLSFGLSHDWPRRYLEERTL